MKRLTALLLAVVLVTALLPIPGAWSFSADDTTFYDGLSDLSAFSPTQTAGVVLDPLGGLRLATNGAVQTATWTTTGDFGGTGPAGPAVGVSTLAPSTGGAGTPGALALASTNLALTPDAANPAVAPTPVGAGLADTFEVQGPTVISVPGPGYTMYYTGVAADGYVQRVYRAVSAGGTISWSKQTGSGTGGSVVDVGPDGSFDEHGIVKPTVMYEPSSTPPYRMWYGALGDTANTIGYAYSSDGVAWTKWQDPTGTPAPALRPGSPGSADGYGVGEPSVTHDNGVYRMWYAASPSPDVSGRQVGYATSTDGAHWSKGGVVSLSGSTGNWDGGWFSPGAWYQAPDPHRMLFAGRKSGVGQAYKLLWADSADGLDWSANNIVLNNGPGGAFDENNVFWSSVLYQPLGTPTHRIYYTGNGGIGDQSRNGIGYATWSGGGGASRVGQAVDRTSPGATARFDTNQTSGGSILPTASPVSLFYAGRSADDLVWRIGRANSSGGAWAKVDGTGDGFTKAVFTLPGGIAYDARGALAPSVATTNAGTSYAMAYEALSNAGVSSIALATVLSPSLDSWTRQAQILNAGSGFYSSKVAHPSLVVPGDGTAYMFFAGNDGVDWEIGLTTAVAAGSLGAWPAAASVLTKGPSGSFDAVGVYDPVVVHTGGSPAWHMVYTGEDAQGVRRLGYATCTLATPSVWTKQGLVMDPSGRPYAFDETGLRAGGAYVDGSSNIHVFFDGIDRGNMGGSAGSPSITWRRIGHAAGAGAGRQPGGRTVFELAPTAPTAAGYGYEFRGFSWDHTVPTGAEARYEVSYYPAYVTAAGTPVNQWSEFVRIDTSPTPTLPVTTQKIRWRVTFERGTAGVSATPQLDEFRAQWASVSFATSGSAVSVPVGPPAGKYADAWKELKVNARIPAGTGVTATVYDPTGAVLVPSVNLSNGSSTISLGTVPQGTPSVTVRFGLTGTGGATPYVDNWQAIYTSNERAPVIGLKTQAHDASVTVSWTDPTYAAYAGTKVLRKTGGFAVGATDTAATTVYSAAGTPGASVTITDTGSSIGGTPTTPLVNGTPYYYSAYTFSQDASGNRLYSPVAKSVAVPKKRIAGLKAASGVSKVTLTWSAPATYPARLGTVLVRRSDTTPTGPTDASATVVARDLPGVSYVDTAVVNGTTYHYAAFTHDRITDGSTAYEGYSDPAYVSATPKFAVTVSIKLQRFNRYRRPYYRYAFRRTVYAYGTVKPRHARFESGARGYVTAYAYQKVRKYVRIRGRRVLRTVWVKVASSKRYLTNYRTHSYWKWSWRPRKRGTFQVKAYFPGDRLHFAKWTSVANVIVY